MDGNVREQKSRSASFLRQMKPAACSFFGCFAPQHLLFGLTPSAKFKSQIHFSDGMIKQLENFASEGFIALIPDDDDRLSFLAELTEKGLTLVDHALTDHMANEKSVLAKLNPAQTKSLAKALQVMIDQLI